MIIGRFGKLVQAAVFGTFAIFGMSFSHVTTLDTSMMNDGMADHKANMAQCQSVCMTAIPTEKQSTPTKLKNNDRKPEVLSQYVANISLALLALPFIVKVLFRLSSWRPPDIVTLNGQRLFYA